MSDQREVAEAVHEGIRIRWSRPERLLILDPTEAAQLTAEAADVLIPIVEAWVNTTPDPYGILLDASRASADTQAWIERWIAFHRSDPRRALIACFRASIFVQGFLMMYGHAAQARLTCWDSERDARAWLAANGIPVRPEPSGTRPPLTDPRR